MTPMPMIGGIVRFVRRGEAKILLTNGHSFWWPVGSLRYGQKVFVAWNHTTDKPVSVHGKEVVERIYDGPGPATPMPPSGSLKDDPLLEDL